MSILGDFMQKSGATTAPAKAPTTGKDLLLGTPPAVNTTPGAITSSIINNANPKAPPVDATTWPKGVDEAHALQKKDPTLWQTISEQLMKPIGLVATAAEQAGQAIGGGTIDPILNMPAKMGGIITGTNHYSFSDLWREDGAKLGLNPTVASSVGLFIDIFADPINTLGGGLTKAGVLAEKATKLKQAGEMIAADSKLAKQIKLLGLTPEDLILGGTKVEQVQKGQRAVLTATLIGGGQKSLIKGEGMYKLLGKTSQVVGDMPAISKASQVVNKIFSTKTPDEAFNVAKTHALNLMEYRKGQAMESAVKLQKDIIDLGVEHQDAVRNVVETGVKSGIPAIDDMAKGIKASLEGMWKQENDLGLVKTKIEDYFPHQKVVEDVSIFGKVKNAFGSAKTFDTKLASTNKRGITKFVNSLGEETIGSAKELGMMPVKTKSAIDAGFTHIDKSGNLYREATGAAKATVSDINSAFGTEFFDPRLAVVYAKRALANAKAVTSAEFYKIIPQFAIEGGETLLPSTIAKIEKLGIDIKGKTFPTEIAQGIEEYAQASQPNEIGNILKTFDSVQNWWKAQALVAPSYHIRNEVGNVWNNYLAGVKDPTMYMQAGAVQLGKAIDFVDDAGRHWNTVSITDAAKKSGVLGQGWFASDIPTAIADEIAGKSWNPLKQNFALFKANQRVGQFTENNARLAHFIDKIKSGATIDDAAASVKKFLFDYQDLTSFEKNVMKRISPFYTWTRKNVPLQLGELIKPEGVAKLSQVAKTQNAIEGGVPTPNEKYLSDYIASNVGIRVRQDEKGNTMYFLMGNWLPAASAIDFLSQPLENFVIMTTPFIKTPIETWSNQSMFFKDTFGDPAMIEKSPQEQGTWLGLTMRKKVKNIMTNIRILNELDKLNPGSVFGDSKNPSLLYKTLPKGTSVNLPLGIGTITPSQKEVGSMQPDRTTSDKILQMMFGKTQLYNPNQAKQFYLWDTDTKVRELEKAIKDAQRGGQSEYAKRMIQELNSVKKERYSSK